jgi:hypothetical protein
MSAPTSELHTELYSGPLASGLAPLLSTAQDAAVAAALNDPAGPAAGTAYLAALSRNDFLLGIGGALLVLPSTSSSIQTKWQQRLQYIQSLDSAVLIGSGSALTQSILNDAVADGILPSGVQTSLFTRQGSRAEVRWGGGTVISAQDVAQAR